MGRKIKVLVPSAILMFFAFSLACDGFFVDPVLTGMSVGPSASLQTGATLQMSAVGTYSDGSQKYLKSGVHWSSDTPSVASIEPSGMVTGVAPGKAIISGSSETVTASATVTITLGGLTSIKVTSSDGLTSIAYGSTEQFVATATANGQEIDVTDSVTWSTNPSSINSVSISSTSGLLTTTSGATTSAQLVVIATDPTSGISGQMDFSVHP